MRLRIATLADYASISEPGKLNILGIFSTIWALQEPIIHAQMQLVLQFEFAGTETGEKEIKIALVDEDGRELLSLSGTMGIPLSKNGEPVTVNQIIGFNNTKFPRFGCYEFKIWVDGEPCETVPVAVLQMKRATASPS